MTRRNRTQTAAVVAAPVAPDMRKMAMAMAEAALDKKAEDVVVLDVRGLTSYADYFVLATGLSDRQVQAVADAILEKLRVEHGERPIGVEGQAGGTWVLLDYGDVVAHVFHRDAREFYDLDGLWADAPRVKL